MGRTVGVGGSTGTTTTRSSAHTITTCSRIGEDDNDNGGYDDDDDNIYIVDIFLFLSIPKNDHNQSCKMSRIWRIYPCKKNWKVGVKSLGKLTVLPNQVCFG